MPALYFHQPVLLTEVIEGLNIQASGHYVDGTFGRGGHSQAILQRLNTDGRLLGFDRDPEAVAAGVVLAQQDPRFAMRHCPFAALTTELSALQWHGQVNGILLDLGVSSPQLDAAHRGFSFLRDGPLDMRMDSSTGDSVAVWLKTVKVVELAEVLKTYGEERHAKRIARAIIAAREQQPITTTKQLAEIVAAAHPAWEPDKHPATQTFQALRIFINQELVQLKQVLPQLLTALAPGGRLAIISFHSLEDRLVKRFIRDAAKGDEYPSGVPVTVDMLHPTLKPIGKAIHAGAEELAQNPRARSAVLRIAEKV